MLIMGSHVWPFIQNLSNKKNWFDAIYHAVLMVPWGNFNQTATWARCGFFARIHPSQPTVWFNCPSFWGWRLGLWFKESVSPSPRKCESMPSTLAALIPNPEGSQVLTILVGGFFPPMPKSKWVHLPQGSGWKYKIFELPPHSILGQGRVVWDHLRWVPQAFSV